MLPSYSLKSNWIPFCSYCTIKRNGQKCPKIHKKCSFRQKINAQWILPKFSQKSWQKMIKYFFNKIDTLTKKSYQFQRKHLNFIKVLAVFWSNAFSSKYSTVYNMLENVSITYLRMKDQMAPPLQKQHETKLKLSSPHTKNFNLVSFKWHWKLKNSSQ